MLWTAVGGIVYLAYMAVRWLGVDITFGEGWIGLGSGVGLIAAGLHLFSRWNGVCLTHCRSPLGCILHKWRSAAFGAWLMGIDPGPYCVGCCWGLMLIMVVRGLMNIVWM